MHQEVEIKAKIEDPKGVERKLRRIGKFTRVRKQVDEYFVPPQQDFFKKNPPIEYLRVRYEGERSHLNYSFLHFRKDGWLAVTDEYETLVQNPRTVGEVLKKIGMIHKVTVEKTRKYFDCGKFEVVLDEVRNLGSFVEVEAKKVFGSLAETRKACMDFLENLKIKYEMNNDMGYPRMLYKKLKSRNR